jgi:hypothetical protein
MKDVLIENEDFCYVDFKDSEITGIKLLKPKKFNGVIFHYGKVGVDEDTDNGEATLKFSYTLVHAGESDFDIDELVDNKELHDIMGKILVAIIMAKIQNDAISENSFEFR